MSTPADKKSAHATIDLRSRHIINPRSTRFVSGKTSECRWWPRKCHVGPWPRGREVARGVVRSSLFTQTRKKTIFRRRRGIEIFCNLFSTHQRPNVFYQPARPASATWTLWPLGGSEPLTSAPCSYFITQSLVLTIDVCRGLETSPLPIKRFAEFFSGRCCPNTLPATAFFLFFFNVLFFFFMKISCS